MKEKKEEEEGEQAKAYRRFNKTLEILEDIHKKILDEYEYEKENKNKYK